METSTPPADVINFPKAASKKASSTERIWGAATRKPFPTKRELANRMDVTEKTIQNNMRAMQKAGLIYREMRKTAAGDWNSNIYHLDGLVAKVQALEPEFAAEKKKRKEIRAALETPAGRRR
jgi:DNA-binding transcriptional MocR family regulator